MNPLDLNLTRTQTMERSFLRNVYIWMSLGLVITALTAYMVASSGLYRSLTGGTGLFLVLVTLALAFTLPNIVMKTSTSAATLLYAAFAMLEGAMLSFIFLAYTKATITSAFFATAGTFTTMALYGTFTKKDLSGLSSFLFMGLIGILLASLVNLFLPPSSTFGVILNYAAVLIFTLLAAYQSQQLKQLAQSMEQQDETSFFRVSLISAFSLYLTFLNLFIRILMIFGRRD